MTQLLTIGQLEHVLLQKYPESNAETWDNTGLISGDATQTITGVACALDPTPEALEQALCAGANVLLTHHPAFLNPPERFFPVSESLGSTSNAQAGAVVYQALSSHIALMNFHTALDFSEEGLLALPQALGLHYRQTLLPLENVGGETGGYGALSETESHVLAGDFAKLCKQVLGGTPRIWGNTQREVTTVVTAQGSATSVLPALSSFHVDCLVCGELKYHDALAAAQSGLVIIELGHDVSEWPLVDVLYTAVCEFGIENVVKLPRKKNWTTC